MTDERPSLLTVLGRPAFYAIAALAGIVALTWSIGTLLRTQYELPFQCEFDCRQRCGAMALPGSAHDEASSQFDPGGPGCGEICGEHCGREVGAQTPPLRIFYDTFDSDPTGAAPLSAPAGDPADDAVTVAGSPGTATVIESPFLGSRACRLARGGPNASVIDLIVGRGGPHDSGIYTLVWSGYAEADQPALTISVLSSSGKRALVLHQSKSALGVMTASGVTTLPGRYAPGTVYTFTVELNLDSNLYSLDVNGTSLLSHQAMLDLGVEDLRQLRMEYPPTSLEAFPGIYVLNSAVMTRL